MTVTWTRKSIEWARSIDQGRREYPISIKKGDLVWVTFAGTGYGRWGIVGGFSPVRSEIKVGYEWEDYRLVHTAEEARERLGITNDWKPPAFSIPADGGTLFGRDTPYQQLMTALRAGRKGSLRVIGTARTLFMLRVSKVHAQPSGTIIVHGKVKKSAAVLTLPPSVKSYAWIRVGTRDHRVSTREVSMPSLNID